MNKQLCETSTLQSVPSVWRFILQWSVYSCLPGPGSFAVDYLSCMYNYNGLGVKLFSTTMEIRVLFALFELYWHFNALMYWYVMCTIHAFHFLFQINQVKIYEVAVTMWKSFQNPLTKMCIDPPALILFSQSASNFLRQHTIKWQLGRTVCLSSKLNPADWGPLIEYVIMDRYSGGSRKLQRSSIFWL